MLPELHGPLLPDAAANALVVPWALMWSLAFTIYAAAKWLSWQRGRKLVPHSPWRSAGYLLAWPGMDATSFLNSRRKVIPPAARVWLTAAVQTVLGAVVLWGIARLLPESQPLLRGWTGMCGAVLLLHFGTFRLAALFWQALRIDADPIMSAPLRAGSLCDFWGKRWNRAFRQLTHELIFVPLHPKLGPQAAGFIVFLASGFIHELVISLPARDGFGLPTLYFVLQGAGVGLERSALGRRLGLRRGLCGRIFMFFIVVGPVLLLFHPPFVLRVIIPFMKVIGAI